MLLKLSVICIALFLSQSLAGAHKCKDLKRSYTYVQGVGYYKFHTQAKNWNDAKRTCEAEGGHLAILNSKKEEQALYRVFLEKSKYIEGAERKDLAFLGVHNSYGKTEWMTIFGEPLNAFGFKAWNRRQDCWGLQPDNQGGNQHCGALIRDCGMMDDVSCEWCLAYICELPAHCAE